MPTLQINRLMLPALLLTWAVLLFGCEQREIQVHNLPWQITVDEAGRLHVFDVTLGETTLWDAVKTWRAHPAVGIFSNADGTAPEAVEAYFDKVRLGPITARMIVRLETSPAQLQALWAGRYNREPQPSGSWKFELADPQLEAAHALPIAEITYIPTPSSDAELLTRRFGLHGRKAAEPIRRHLERHCREEER